MVSPLIEAQYIPKNTKVLYRLHHLSTKAHSNLRRYQIDQQETEGFYLHVTREEVCGGFAPPFHYKHNSSHRFHEYLRTSE
jgi:hypothetical protein